MERPEKMGKAQTRKTFSRQGAPLESMFGVKVADLKTLLRPLKGDQGMAL
jgi:hypothetical protein